MHVSYRHRWVHAIAGSCGCFLQNQTVRQTYRLQLGQVCKTACKQLIHSQSLNCVILPLDGLKSLQVCFAARYNYHLIQLSLSSIFITPRSHQHLSLSVVLRLDWCDPAWKEIGLVGPYLDSTPLKHVWLFTPFTQSTFVRFGTVLLSLISSI